MGGSYTGPSLPRPPSSDSNEDREMDFDDHRDFMDQDVLIMFLQDSSLLPILEQSINS